MHRQVDAIQIVTHNICLYKEVHKNYTGCNFKTMELLDCALIGACAVIRLITVPLDKALFQLKSDIFSFLHKNIYCATH